MIEKIYKERLKKEFELLDSALDYWGDENLNFILKAWYNILSKLSESKDGGKTND